jgi:hypothetical protein
LPGITRGAVLPPALLHKVRDVSKLSSHGDAIKERDSSALA